MIHYMNGVAPMFLQPLQNSNYDFYLGGSRRMRDREAEERRRLMVDYTIPSKIQLKDDTDYDLYVTFSADVVAYLESVGFVITDNGYDANNDGESIDVDGDNDSIPVAPYNSRRSYNYAKSASPLYATSQITMAPVDDEEGCDTELLLVMTNGRYQIQLRRDAEFYRNVFESITIDDYVQHLWKSGPNAPKRVDIQYIFNRLFEDEHRRQELLQHPSSISIRYKMPF